MDILFPLLGGLGLFLYGMNEMSNGLARIAGYRLKSLLHTLTANRFLGLTSGLVITSIVQASSVTTVMVVGFVNAGLIALPQAISVILGAHIGTTITAQIIAFKIGAISLPLIALGAILHLFSKSESLKNIGGVLFGAGAVFYGLTLMVSAFHPLHENQAIAHLFVSFSHYPLLGFFIGMMLTILVQSSSVTTGITIALALASLVTFEQAVPLILGENIGTTITANIAAISGSYVAKQAARAHFIINTTGALLAFLFLVPFMKLVLALSPATDIARQIANAHTLFNVLTTLLFLPLIGLTARITSFFIAGKKEDTPLVYLEDSSLEEPETALDQVKRALRETNEMALEYLKILSKAVPLLHEKEIPAMTHRSQIIEQYKSRTTEYLEKIPLKNLSKSQSNRIPRFVRIIHEIERTHDYEEKMKKVMTDMLSEGRIFPPFERRTLGRYFEKGIKIMRNTNNLFEQTENIKAHDIIESYETMYNQKNRLRKGNRERLEKGKIAAAVANYYDDMVTSLEEIAKKCRNIAKALIE